MPAKTAKTAKPRPKTAAPAAFEPIRIGRSKAADDDPGMPLFVLDDADGNEVEYRIPTKVSRSVVLEFMRVARTEGEMGAAQRALERLLGPDAYKALEQSDEVTDEDLEQIFRAVIQHIAGVTEPGND